MSSPAPLKGLLVLLPGLALLLINLVGSIVWLAPFGTWLVISWVLLASAGIVYGLFRLVMRYVITPLTVTVRADALHLHYPSSGREQTIGFQQICTYKLEANEETDTLRLRLTNTATVRIVANGKQSVTELVHGFEKRLRAYCSLTGTAAPLREKNFRPSTAANLALAVPAALLIALTIALFVFGEPVKWYVFIIYAGFGCYLWAWLSLHGPPKK